ncbi:MAG: hypothetical protein RMJ98_06990 [Myxococcales bacterium]|nr:hypothetical protein [Polyangiaceae bacterium]MDW8249032.1 hypothetical protein [Myxococcales bacterium]
MNPIRARSVVVATHGHCFDGMASAVVFTRLYRGLYSGTEATFTYRACDYSPGDSAVPTTWMTGDDNAILDFRYTALPNLTWYFDHHATAFRTERDREHFESRPPDRRFHNAAYPSCTRLIADTARDHFGLDLGDLDDLLCWADRIDTASFASAEEAVRREAPELRLMSVLEHHGNDTMLNMLIPRLLREPLREVASSEEIQIRYAPIARQRQRNLERLRHCTQERGHIAFCDLGAEAGEVIEKFGLYWLFPQATYSVILCRTPGKAKISIGFNPWGPSPRRHHIGEICRRHGGGGHPVVGAINLSPQQLARVHEICAEILAELNS